MTAFVCTTGLVFYLAFGIGSPGRGPLAAALNALFQVLVEFLYPDVARYTLVCLLALIPGVVSLAVFARLTPRRRSDGMIHCLRCDYVLKGLSEPRCPECGERI